jgi:hypothetical protein
MLLSLVTWLDISHRFEGVRILAIERSEAISVSIVGMRTPRWRHLVAMILKNTPLRSPVKLYVPSAQQGGWACRSAVAFEGLPREEFVVAGNNTVDDEAARLVRRHGSEQLRTIPILVRHKNCLHASHRPQPMFRAA